jgi:PAS domain S-box-containing protein
MNSIQKTERLFGDRVQKLSESMLPGIATSLINSVILALVLVKYVDNRRLIIWIGAIVVICILRFFVSFYYRQAEKSLPVFRRYQYFFISGLALTGIAWGSTAFIIFPEESVGHQVFIAFVLGGMVAGTVGIYSAIWSAFFAFSIPTMFPIIIKFFLMGEQLYIAMAALSFIFWGVMMVTAVKFNRDITGYFLLKYSNLDLILDLESEMKSRKAVELDLKEKNLEIEGIVERRTEELLEANKKLLKEIEERQIIATALKENEEKYRQLVESINDVIYATDEKGVLTYVSPVVWVVFGYEPKELVGEKFSRYVHPDDREMFTAVLPKRRAGDINPIEYRFRTKINEYRWVRSSSRAVFRDGVCVGLRGILTDISEKRKLEEQLQRSHKMEAIATLSGGIAHDFNNLLAIILGNTELAMMEVKDGTSVYDYMERIVASSMRAKSVVKELLSFARQTNAEKKSVDIAAAVQAELNRLEPSLPPSITLTKEIASNIEATFGDAAQVGQMVTNLWDNAVDAMADGGGKLTVKVKKVVLSKEKTDFDPDMEPGEYVQLTVKDSGVGILPENICRLFDPYYTTKDFSAGGGLGLAVVHGVAKRHRGGIRVTSEPGKGARFDVFFATDEMTADLGVSAKED